MDIGQIILTALFALVGSFLGLVFTRVYDYIWKPFFVDNNMKRLREDMNRLKVRYDDVEIQVSKAKLEMKTCTNEVKWWLDKIKSIEDEVIHIEEEISTWRSNYAVVYSYMIFWKRYNIGYKVVTKYREVTKLLKQDAFKDVATELPPPVARVLPSTPRVQAMDINRDQILRYLNDKEVKIIGIWGMGGVGKTTLLKQINNYFAYDQRLSFDHVIFVVASKNINVEELQKKILEDLRLPSKKDDINSQAILLLSFLKNKKVLLLLDDLWKHVDLIYLGIPLEHGKCRVVFTTRSLRVCRLMKAEKELKVECLNKKEAWSLFEKNVGGDIIRADLNIGRLAKEVVKECCGLPLALITIGSAMSDKKTWREWQDVLNLLHSSRHDEILGMSDEMFLILEFSYQNLQTDTIRECFLTCSMWPEDFDIFEDDLIMCWMGLGLIDDYNEINEAFDRGHSIIENLIGACLLELVDGVVGYFRVKMHDVLRDLALWIASDHGQNKNKWIVQANIGLKECKIGKWKGAHRISLMRTNIESLPEKLPECPELSVLMLKDNSSMKSIPQGLFHCFRFLTYLDLEYCYIKELPATIGHLVNLNFLNLRHTFVKYLPYELGNLMNLKYLFLGGTSLKVIPWELISRLSMLKVLELSHKCEAVEMESQGAFEALKQLDGQLVGLSISISTVLGLNQLLKFSTISILELHINTLEGIESLELLSPMLFSSKATTNSLQSLILHNCSSLKVLIVDSLYSQGIAGLKTLPRLESLRLQDLALLEKIVWRGVTPQEFLPSLRLLFISLCHKLKNVSWVLQLPNLEGLDIHKCDELEMVIGDVGDGGGAFPKLRVLHLQSLENLGSICNTTIRFPSLEGIVVINCPKLKKLPFQALNIPDKLQVIRGSGKWWEDVDWEDGNTKSLLQNYFKADEYEVPEAKKIDPAIQEDLQEYGVWQETSVSEDADLCGPSGASKCG